MRSQRSPFRTSPATRRAAALTAAAALSLGLAGCGGDDSSTASVASAGSTGSSAPTTSSTPAAPSASGAASASAATTSSTTGAPGPKATASGTPGRLTRTEATEDPADDAGWVSGPSDGGTAGDAGVETDLRIGSHDGYDRVVVETSGDGTLGFRATYVDAAATQGKGDPISVGGTHTLQVIGRGTTMPVTEELRKVAYTDLGLHEVGDETIAGVYLDGTFEGQFQVVIGTDATEYRVFTLSNPTRLVIDVKRP
ncbi:AMIN-like domain-containing (lipo)protein [Actinomyces haliotis]|uniref:AMIN-like domain-containing (lipo)protein n=1 Tax=Actinomyces haliotis TaxID=1280843 RepID=UPI00188FD5E6|nr:AMIN domain-containing protein [Actinomyces haliotis]